MSFVHLHVHSQYSLLEATCRFNDLAAKAQEMGMPALANTDYGNMFGAVEFYFAARKKEVKPIIGLEVYIAPKSRLIKGEDKDIVKMPNRRLVLLAKNLEGYRNLCKISSVGYKEGFYYRPRIDYEILNKYNSDLVALSGGLMGEVPWTFINKGEEQALEKIKEFKKIYGDNFYLEMNRTGVSAWEEINPFLAEASKITGVSCVAANDVHYAEQKDQIAQEVLICIGSNKTLQDESRYKLGTDQFYFKSPDQMRALFKNNQEICDRTLEIAEQCNVEFKLEDESGKPIYHLPSYPTKKGITLEEEIKRLSKVGLEKRFEEAEARGEKIEGKQKDIYQERLEYELGVISNMGFNGYFLIVQDFIMWAKNNDIPVGPGRGSGAGSLVAYCLQITDLDPLPYHLIFERFLNPERVSMPDFDIDFCQENRQRVIEYVTKKYGEQSVSQIITYGKLQARAAIRDVGRVLGMTYGEVDVVAKLVPDKLGINLKEAIEEEPRMRELMDNDPKVANLMDFAQRIEGLVRHAGIHAAGVIIADGDIVSHAPLYRGTEDENVVQYDMKHAEQIGLIKFDFLGLKTLTHINDALKLVKQNRGKNIKTSEISLSDSGIYEIMSRGDTAGIFQFESDGITDLIRKSQPNCFEDIVAINALYRPGPMEMIPEYLKRKKGEVQVKYLFPELEEITKETHGIIVYQEQVQLIAAKIANYSLGEADILRKAMGKKIAEVMEKQKDRFVKGALENKFDEKKASKLFDSMAEFAKYGFNKAHASAYCVVAAYTAFLKNYYPVEFFAALLSTEMSDTDKIVKYVKDAQKHDIEVLQPNINVSEFKFTVKGDQIFFSLGAIKGVGQAAVESILEARNSLPDKKFETLEQFFEVADLRRVNKKTVECLIKSGAFDGFGANRAELMKGYVKFIERADQIKTDREVGQTSLFAMAEDVNTQEQDKVKLEKSPPWKRSTRLAYEKEVLGFYLSDHPLNGIGDLAKKWTTGNIKGFQKLDNKTHVSVLGIVSSLREIITKKGTRMAFAQFEDLSDSVELVVFPNAFATGEMILKSERPIIVSGAMEREGDACKILVDKVERVEEAFRRAKKLIIHMEPGMEPKVALIKEILQKHPGDTSLTMKMRLEDIEKIVDLELSNPRGVLPSQELVEGLQGILGDTKSFEFRI